MWGENGRRTLARVVWLGLGCGAWCGWGVARGVARVWLGCGAHASSLERRALQELEATCNQTTNTK